MPEAFGSHCWRQHEIAALTQKYNANPDQIHFFAVQVLEEIKRGHETNDHRAQYEIAMLSKSKFIFFSKMKGLQKIIYFIRQFIDKISPEDAAKCIENTRHRADCGKKFVIIYKSLSKRLVEGDHESRPELTQ